MDPKLRRSEAACRKIVWAGVPRRGAIPVGQRGGRPKKGPPRRSTGLRSRWLPDEKMPAQGGHFRYQLTDLAAESWLPE